jgi:hypothetical protein
MARALTLSCWLAATSVATGAWAQTLDLEGARALFAEGLKDETAGRCTDALPKYNSVLAVKDTPNVRFRIGACEEQLGHKAAALRAYAASVRLGQGDSQAKDVVNEANKRAEKLGTGTLIVHAPEGASIVIDGERVGADDAIGLWLDPGRHHVEVSAPGKKPFSAAVAVRGGATSTVDAVLANDTPPPPPPPMPPSSTAGTRRVLGVSLVALGGLLAGAGVVSIVIRETSISSLKSACPGGTCPTSRQAELLSTRDQALTAGPLAAIFAGAAAVSLGVGLVLWITAKDPRPATAALVPVFGPTSAGIVGTF